MDPVPPEPLPWLSAGEGRFILYGGDCAERLPQLPWRGQVNMIFADPPYFLSNNGVTCQGGRRTSVNKGAWDRLQTVEDMHAFNTRWLRACHDVLHPDGTIWVSGTRHVIYSVGFAMQQLGFKLLNEVTWEKPNPPPNLGCRSFTHSTETILWAARSAKSRHTFNYPQMKEINGGKQMKTVWTMSAPGKAEKTEGRHPTQKPLTLLQRIILASTRPEDRVLDPFCGSGTTGIAAWRLGRTFVGIEEQEEYLALCRRRLLREAPEAG